MGLFEIFKKKKIAVKELPIKSNGETFAVPLIHDKKLDVYLSQGSYRHRVNFHVTKMLERMYGKNVDFGDITYDVKIRTHRKEVIVKFRKVFK